ncbi:hypothetical protein ACFMI8_18810, partial [Acinetobacter baumannii]|uniref:hypothetical protein n=1 Tax=Acinetobacter baumannii TaxID=470 RepID=UPI00366FCFFE
MIEYELLKIIWWVLVGVLLIGFALTDGFDMMIGIQLPKDCAELVAIARDEYKLI